MKKTNIFFILDKLTYGGGEVLLIQLCRLLNKMNFSVFIYVLDRQLDRRAFEELQLEGASVRALGKNRVDKLFSLYFEKDHFFINSYSLKTNFIVRVFFGLFRKAKIISHHHGNGKHLPMVAVILNRFTFFLSDKNICVSKGTLRSIYGTFLNHKSMSVIYNFSNYEAASTPKSKFDRIELISVNRLIESKNIFSQLEIVNIIKEMGREVRLKIVGDGPEKKGLEEYIKSHGLVENVILVGQVDNSSVQTLLDDACMLIMTSQAEGLGIVLLEAFSRGLPACAFDIDGVNEVVEHDYNGKLVEVNNTVSFAENILDVFDRSYEEFSLNALETIKRKFEKEAILREYKKVYSL